MILSQMIPQNSEESTNANKDLPQKNYLSFMKRIKKQRKNKLIIKWTDYELVNDKGTPAETDLEYNKETFEKLVMLKTWKKMN